MKILCATSTVDQLKTKLEKSIKTRICKKIEKFLLRRWEYEVTVEPKIPHMEENDNDIEVSFTGWDQNDLERAIKTEVPISYTDPEHTKFKLYHPEDIVDEVSSAIERKVGLW